MYLGVMLDKSLSWSSHITYVANKATRVLNFLKRHLSKCSTAIKASAYLLLVRPLMEYACAVWDPHYLSHIYIYIYIYINIGRRYKGELPDGLYLIIVTVVV